MPRWWVWIFWATIVFSVLYFLDVGGIGVGDGRIAQYERDVAAARALHPETGPAMSEAQLAALAKDPAAVALGKATFATNCAACHGADGGGVIGPNLADDYWLHGGSLGDIQRSVADGVLAKGMPAWGKMLKPDQLSAVVAYVVTLRGTKPAKPKEPQGTLAAPAAPLAVAP
jgi:cytochrome c oxidase cbb3-type subunit 3